MKKWKLFIQEIKIRADKDDQRQILFEDFVGLLQERGYALTEKEKLSILKAFPGKQVGDQGKKLNISRIYDQKFTNMLDNIYDNFNSEVNKDNILTDAMGYLGKSEYYREKFKLTAISEEEFILNMYKGKKLGKVMLMVREIDAQRNGYVTSYELDDIIKLQYPNEFKTKDLTPIISKFESI